MANPTHTTSMLSRSIGALALLASIVAIWFIAQPNTLTPTPAKLAQASQSIQFDDPTHFSFDVSKVAFSDGTGITLATPASSADVILLDPLPVNGSIVGFEQQAALLSGTAISYQLSGDGRSWSYYDGTTWTAARDCAERCSNTALDIDTHIHTLPIATDRLHVRTFLSAISEASPILNSVSIRTEGGVVEEEPVVTTNELASVFATNKVKICHATSSESNPYTFLEVSQSSVDGEGENDHTHHNDDIIPITDRNDDGHIDGDDCDAPAPSATIVATKIICDQESDLPNWGGGGPNVTSSTATNFLASHSDCQAASGWKFQWTDESSSNPGDSVEVVGNPWVSFGPTNASGVAQVSIPLDDIDDDIWVREQLKSGFIGFGHSTSSTNSAEFYCHKDVNNYNNYDKVEDIDANQTYYCVGFNVPTSTSTWDHSSIEVTGSCSSGSAVFTIKNTGSSMGGTSQYRVYRNNVLVDTQTFQLTAGQQTTVTVAGNGDDIRLEADQRPDHPGNSQPQATVEDCGTTSPTATISATKIVCNVESDLPNWGGGGPDITSATAAAFVSSHPNCHLQSGWQFQWAKSTATDPGDNLNLASTPWTTFGPTNGTGVTQTTVSLAGIGDRIWVREALQPDYLGFGYANGNNSNSAEFYCHKDVLNYDNYDFIINPSANTTYHCVGFNVAMPDTSDHSNVEVAGVCEAPYAIFTITNTGSGPMTAASQYRVYRNNILEDTQSFQLNAGQSIVVSVPGNGETIRVEADQLPGHIGTPQATIQNCGTPNQPPVAVDDTDDTLMNTPVTTDILVNDSDPDGTIVPNTVSILDAPDNGSIGSISGITGHVTYIPNPGFYGIDTYQYQVCDNGGLCDTATVTITVKAPPIAVDDTATTPFQTPVTINVLGNDSDPDGTLIPSTVVVTAVPTNGTITSINPTTGEITYTPNEGFSGTDFFSYQVCDNDGLCDTATVAVSVNDKILYPPVALDDSGTTLRNTPVVLGVLANDSDIDGTLVPSSVTVTLAPLHGTITFINTLTGEITYTPTTGFTGDDQFTYQVCDNDGLCDTAIVTIHVVAPPLVPPVAINDASSTQQNTPVTIPVLSNDSDSDGVLVPATTTVITPPLNGTTSVNVSTGEITYTPSTGFTGLDSFTYQVCDNDSLCDTAVVLVAVNPPALIPPVANNDTATTDQDTPVTIAILTNDSDADGTLVPSTVHIVTPAVNGTISAINPTTGAITYLPNPGFSGTDVFTYEVCDDDGLCDTATATITVQSGVTIFAHKIVCEDEADLPNWGTGGPNVTAATASTFIATHQGCALTSDWNFQWGPTSASNPGDNTGEALPTTGYTTFGPTNTLGLAQVTLPASVITSRIWLREVWQSGYIPFTYGTSGNSNNVSAEFYCHNDVLNYDNWDYIDNIALGSTYYCIGFNVAEIQPLPPIAIDDATTTNQDVAVAIDILNNDSDPDGVLAPSTVTVTTPPTSGTITAINTLTGEVTYQPNPGFSGIDTFTYQVCDDDGLCDTALVTVIIEPVLILLPPIANDDTTTTPPSTPVTINVLANDTDADGVLVPSTTAVILLPSNGTVTGINVLTGEITYLPNPGFFGLDSLTYIVCDNDGLCDTAVVSITVTEPAPVPPIANDDAAVTPENTPVTIDILLNDTDSDGVLVPSTVTVTSPPANGTITTINGTTGQVTYLPNTNFTGLDIFTYQVCDDDGLCDIATVTIGINNVPVPPVANDDSATTALNTPVSLPLLVNDFDIDGVLVPSTTSIVSQPTSGTVTVDITGIATYTPSTSFTGSDQFSYQVCDNDGLCDTAIATITINPTDTPPPTPPVTPPTPPLVVPLAIPLAAPTVVAPTPIVGNLIFGANQFVLAAQSQPLSGFGVLQIVTNQPQTFYLEARGATTANVINLTTQTVYPLTFDANLKLWTGTFSFPEAGTYQLQGQIGNGSQTYTREINQVVVTDPSTVTIGDNPADATITVFEQDPSTGNFHQWNGTSYAQPNPFSAPGSFALVLPEGEFYLQVTSPGYNSLTSRIVSLDQQSFVTARIALDQPGTILERLFARFVRTNQTNNFALDVTVLPETNQLPLGEPVPAITAHTASAPDTDLLSPITTPTVLMVYSNWNTLAQEQLQVFTTTAARVGSAITFIPLSTMDPDADDLAYLSRGQYSLELYKPSDSFFDQYLISSLPQFFFLDADHQLVRSIIGPQSVESLTNVIRADLLEIQ